MHWGWGGVWGNMKWWSWERFPCTCFIRLCPVGAWQVDRRQSACVIRRESQPHLTMLPSGRQHLLAYVFLLSILTGHGNPKRRGRLFIVRYLATVAWEIFKNRWALLSSTRPTLSSTRANQRALSLSISLFMFVSLYIQRRERNNCILKPTPTVFLRRVLNRKGVTGNVATCNALQSGEAGLAEVVLWVSCCCCYFFKALSFNLLSASVRCVRGRSGLGSEP